MKIANTFKKEAAKTAFDLTHRGIIQYNMSKYDAAVETGKRRYADLDQAKTSASAIKDYAINKLPLLLKEFEKNATANGAEVFWAEDTNVLVTQLLPLLYQLEAKAIVKSKSMVTEEIELNYHLAKAGIDSLETDLGEFIVQVAGEKPYHIVTPAMHKSKKDIAELFNRHFNTDKELSAEALTGFVRQLLREKFMMADVGVTGANFLCAREGAVAVTENEGNALLSSSFPKTHIVIAGIEKVLPSIDDLALFWPLLAAHGTGQQLTVYSNLFFGPKKASESDGPERMLIFLLDNKRSQVYEDEALKASLKCIRCGACLNGCPVYKNIGGYTYSSTYSGPIGSVLSPHFNGFDQYKHLSFASSLCGKCDSVCPVKIPLSKLLLYNRQKAQTNNGFTEKCSNNAIFTILSKRWLMNAFSGKQKSKLLKLFQARFIGKGKQLDSFNAKTFNEQWKKHKKR